MCLLTGVVALVVGVNWIGRVYLQAAEVPLPVQERYICQQYEPLQTLLCQVLGEEPRSRRMPFRLQGRTDSNRIRDTIFAPLCSVPTADHMERA